jgi:acetyl esterase/lipase
MAGAETARERRGAGGALEREGRLARRRRCSSGLARRVTLTTALLLLAACSGPDALNAITSDEGTRRIVDLRYGEGPRAVLDLTLPPGGAAPDAPVLVFFHGGAWRSGDKRDYPFLASAFAARGWIVAVPNYRLVPEGQYPVFMQDAARAVAALPGLLAANGLGGERPLVVAGHSAGAQIAASLALDRRWLAAHGKDPCRDIAALLGISGPYDFLPATSRLIRAAFGEAASGTDAEPITHAGPRAPAAVLLTGAADTTVAPRNSAALARALQAAGRPASLAVYPGIGHIDILLAVALPFRHVAPTLEDADAGLRTALALPPPTCA